MSSTAKQHGETMAALRVSLPGADCESVMASHYGSCEQRWIMNKNANITWQDHKVGKAQRSEQKRQTPCVLWFTGLSGSGKSTLANALEQKLYELNHHTYLLDGDNVRHGLNKDLGFSDADRKENIRRIGELSALFVDAGMLVLAAFISPFRTEREFVRQLVGAGSSWKSTWRPR